MANNQYAVFFDENSAYPIKIHKIECVWRKKYEQEHKPTIHTKWYDVPNLQAAKKIAQEISRENDNRNMVQAKCGGNCFSR